MKSLTMRAVGALFLLASFSSFAADTPSSNAHEELMSSMNKMHQQMQGMQSSENADVDFTKMMIQHHQTGIEMMKSELKNGSDPKVKNMAQKMIESQKMEIKQMQAWLDRKPKAKE